MSITPGLEVFALKDTGHLKRGNLLWESSRMFLPEHREQLLEHRRHQREFEPPELGEDQRSELDTAIREALSTGRRVIITYAGRYEPERLNGQITRVDPFKEQLRLETEEGIQLLPLAKLLQLEWD